MNSLEINDMITLSPERFQEESEGFDLVASEDALACFTSDEIETFSEMGATAKSVGFYKNPQKKFAVAFDGQDYQIKRIKKSSIILGELNRELQRRGWSSTKFGEFFGFADRTVAYRFLHEPNKNLLKLEQILCELGLTIEFKK